MKQKQVKRICALLLAAAMSVGCLTACGSDNNKEESSQSSKEESSQSSKEESSQEASDGEIALDHFAGTELTIAVLKNVDFDKSESFEDKAIVQMAEEATGIHINWIEIESSAAGERMDVILSSGELPDAMLGLVGSTTLAQNETLFYDLSQDGLLETYAPDVLASYEQGGQDIMDKITFADGSIRSLVGNTGSSWASDFTSLWYINKAWLDQLGMDVPTNAEEFYNVLCAFRDNDMNGNGDTSDEIPMSFCNNDGTAMFWQYANAFGIGGSELNWTTLLYMVKDGVVTPTVDSEQYKAFLEYFHKLASEGLLDVEGFSQTNEQYMAKQAENKVGVFMAWGKTNCGTPEDYVTMAPFQGMEGVEPVKTGMKNTFFGNTTAFVASAECSNIEALLHWWNYISSTPELRQIARFGANYHYYDEEGRLRKGVKVMEEGVDYNVLTYTEGIGNVTAPYITPYDTYEYIAEGSVRSECFELLDHLLVKEYIPNRMMDPEKANDRILLETDLFPVISEFCANSVVDGITEDSWAAYLDELNDYKYYDWINWWQDYYDGKF